MLLKKFKVKSFNININEVIIQGQNNKVPRTLF